MPHPQYRVVRYVPGTRTVAAEVFLTTNRKRADVYARIYGAEVETRSAPQSRRELKKLDRKERLSFAYN